MEDAEIAGTFDGAITATGNPIVRATGRVMGTARYRRLQVEDGGQVSGRLEMLSDAPAPTGAGGARPLAPAASPNRTSRGDWRRPMPLARRAADL